MLNIKTFNTCFGGKLGFVFCFPSYYSISMKPLKVTKTNEL